MTQGAEPTTQRPRFWLLTSPRTASNLLVKILNLDEQGVRPAYMGGYFFMPSMIKRILLHGKALVDWSEEERSEVEKLQQESFDRLQNHIAAAEEEGQIVFIKEHVGFLNSPLLESQYIFGSDGNGGEPSLLNMKGVENPTRSALNLTSLPDEFLKTWHPTFLIRHPAMMLPSLYRTNKTEGVSFGRPNNELLPIEITMKWFRALHAFYSAYFGEGSSWPVVLDADDIMTRPQVVAKYAQLVNFDSDKLRFSWDKASEDKLKQISVLEQRMLSSINASSKVDTGKVAGNIDIDEEAAKWRAEFGEEAGNKLERWVRDAMPDYEFLHAQRLTVE